MIYQWVTVDFPTEIPSAASLTYVETRRETPYSVSFKWNGRGLDLYIDDLYVGQIQVTP
ncbi:MAG TPA: hypothetical protein VGI47_04080 [Candidatus Binataceae bacterium]|jgi:hypothetical protein